MKIPTPKKENLHRFALAYILASMTCPWIRSHVIDQATRPDDTRTKQEPGKKTYNEESTLPSKGNDVEQPADQPTR
jgi:hypothetical protein